MLLHEGRKGCDVGSFTEPDEAKGFAVARVAHEAEAHFAIHPCLNAKTADVNDHPGRVRDSVLYSGHPVVAGLQIVVVEPNLEAVAAEDFRKLTGGLNV